ncbi:MAG: flavin reductase family protein [Propionibacteriaceae bacterium]
MTIHDEHPFADPPASRDPLRQFRGRLPAPVTVVATGSGSSRAGLTVSSVLLAPGEPGQLVTLIDPDSDVGSSLEHGTKITVSVLGPDDMYLAEAFAGLAPAPGGRFRLGSWAQTDWGPAIDGAPWLGAKVTDLRPMGWSLEVTARVEHVEPAVIDPLVHVRGRYLTVDVDAPPRPAQ